MGWKYHLIRISVWWITDLGPSWRKSYWKNQRAYRYAWIIPILKLNVRFLFSSSFSTEKFESYLLSQLSFPDVSFTWNTRIKSSHVSLLGNQIRMEKYCFVQDWPKANYFQFCNSHNITKVNIFLPSIDCTVSFATVSPGWVLITFISFGWGFTGWLNVSI